MNEIERAKLYLLDNNYPAIQYERRIITDLLSIIERQGEEIEKVKRIAIKQIDEDGKIAQWNKGREAGIKAAGFDYELAHDAYKKLKQERANDNAAFTKEIMRLESDIERRKEEAFTREARIMFYLADIAQKEKQTAERCVEIVENYPECCETNTGGRATNPEDCADALRKEFNL
jgi:hypothetical protein